jgi:hypothetical protein
VPSSGNVDLQTDDEADESSSADCAVEDRVPEDVVMDPKYQDPKLSVIYKDLPELG